MNDRVACIYRRGDWLYFSTMNKSVMGVWISGPNPVRISTIATADEIGNEVGLALSNSIRGIPHPTDWKAVQQPLLALAGVKNWNMFSKGLIACGVGVDSTEKK